MDTPKMETNNKDYILNQLLYFSDETMNLLNLLGECIDYTFFKLGHSSLANKLLIKIGELKTKKIMIDRDIQRMFPKTRTYYERKKG